MMDKKIILGYTRRLLAIIPSIFFCALGVALLVSPEWGSDPLTTFEIGLSNVFHVQLGTAALVFEGIVFFVFLIIRRDLVHLGTLAWCFLTGPFCVLKQLSMLAATFSRLVIEGKVNIRWGSRDGITFRL